MFTAFLNMLPGFILKFPPLFLRFLLFFSNFPPFKNYLPCLYFYVPTIFLFVRASFDSAHCTCNPSIICSFLSLAPQPLPPLPPTKINVDPGSNSETKLIIPSLPTLSTVNENYILAFFWKFLIIFSFTTQGLRISNCA
jgi:hypothetical protein